MSEGKPLTTPIVRSIQLFPKRKEPPFYSQEVLAVADFGLEGNRKSKPGSDRQVLLIEGETLDELGLEPGSLRENLTTQGIDLHVLGPGSQIKVGHSAVLEITKYCTVCSRVEEVRPGLMREVSGRRGMLARVLTGGPIAVGDSIEVLRRTKPRRSKLPG